MGLQVNASAMHSLMKRVEVLANNISNNQTVGFKRMDLDFADQIVKYSRKPTPYENPVGKFTGQGVKITGTEIEHKQGSFKITENSLDFAINGPGFFKLLDPITGENLYTRNGSFKFDEQGRLVTSSGYLLDPPIQLQPSQIFSHISEDGRVWVREPGTANLTNLGQLTLSTFVNPAGLYATGNSTYKATSSSGAEIQGQPKQNGIGSIISGALETSNVSLVKEMVDLINTQKAYDTNHKVIIAEDKMASLGDILGRR
ncbi:MAG: flagellar basal-body rod protein FlgF [Candidatus Sericytochromatia bacterium]|nr:MAG: flagellar basal-body rod protein FlgF [Candidatus Sericytochromatia bacterium]